MRLLTPLVLCLNACVIVVDITDDTTDTDEPDVPSVGTLTSTPDPLFWTGTVTAAEDPIVGAPPECALVPCDHFTLDVALPDPAFDPNQPGGLQVAIRWFGDPGPFDLPPGVPGCCGELDTLHLFVYRDGAPVAVSAGIIATAQSVFLPDPANGTYDLWIAWEPTYNVSPEVTYEGLAQIELLPPIQPVDRLLPDLTFRTTERITFLTPSFPFFEPDPPPGASCFDSETAETGAQNCLRFDQIIANDGVGPLEVEFDVATGLVPADGEDFPASQRVYATDGSSTGQLAGSVEYHGIHGHFHYSSFADSVLWASDVTATKLGVAPVVEAHKVSFCMADIRVDAWGETGDGPRTYFAPDCLLPASSDGVTDHFVQGITNGWSDVYDWYIPDQYIEVTGQPDGFYILEMCADPEGAIEEADETNNCIGHHLWIEGVGTPGQTVDLLGLTP